MTADDPIRTDPLPAGNQALADAHARMMLPFVRLLQRSGVDTLDGLAAGLNELNMPRRRGGPWQAEHVRRLLKRIG